MSDNYLFLQQQYYIKHIYSSGDTIRNISTVMFEYLKFVIFQNGSLFHRVANFKGKLFKTLNFITVNPPIKAFIFFKRFQRERLLKSGT